MLKNILYQTDILNGLLSQNDFEFLKDTSAKQEALKSEIMLAESKREHILQLLKNLDSQVEPYENNDTYSQNVQNAFHSINAVIRKLNDILEAFNTIEQDIVTLIIKKNSNEHTNVAYRINEINIKITNFKNKQNVLLNDITNYNLLVDSFLAELKLSQPESSESKLSIPNFVSHEKKVFTFEDNLELRISEKKQRVYLPYTKSEIQYYLDNYPNEYKTPQDVINGEFVVDISIYNKHPVLARFREAYSLSKNKEMKSTIDSLKYAMDLMFRRDLNPSIIAAVKSQKQLNDYIECLENNKLDNFSYFRIIFEVNPI